MISAVPSVSSVHVELVGRLPSTPGRTDETTKFKIIRSTSALERIFPILDLSFEEKVVRWKWNWTRSCSAIGTPEPHKKTVSFPMSL
jgi:hypothetical protein